MELKAISFTEHIGYIAAFITTVSFLPQLIKIMKTKNTSSISLLFYMFFGIGVGLWCIYGLLIQSLPVLAANFVTLGMVGLILFFKIKHG